MYTCTYVYKYECLRRAKKNIFSNTYLLSAQIESNQNVDCRSKKKEYEYVLYIFSTIHISCRFLLSKTTEARRNGVGTEKNTDKSSNCDAYVTCDDVRCFLKVFWN